MRLSTASDIMRSPASRGIHTSVLVCAVLAFFLVGLCAASAEGFMITKKIAVGGQGGWDYLAVDEDARRLYVPTEPGLKFSTWIQVQSSVRSRTHLASTESQLRRS
jgi:hypothetical protein